MSGSGEPGAGVLLNLLAFRWRIMNLKSKKRKGGKHMR